MALKKLLTDLSEGNPIDNALQAYPNHNTPSTAGGFNYGTSTTRIFDGKTFRQKSFEKIKTSSLQSRAIAGVANKTFIFVLPGSMDACITAWQDIITHQLNSDTKPCNLVIA